MGQVEGLGRSGGVVLLGGRLFGWVQRVEHVVQSRRDAQEVGRQQEGLARLLV